MTGLLPAFDGYIARLEAGIQKESEAIAEAVAAHQVGDGAGHWKEKHRLETRLWAARAMRDVIAEVAE